MKQYQEPTKVVVEPHERVVTCAELDDLYNMAYQAGRRDSEIINGEE